MVVAAAQQALERARDCALLMGFNGFIPEISRALSETKATYSYANVPTSLRHLRSRFRDELTLTWLLHVPNADVDLYGKRELFGRAVAEKFDVSEDVEAAGNCLALGQGTACVFHLMRVMERGVHTLGRKLKVKFDPAKQSWFEICNLASKAATNRAAKTSRQRASNAALGAAVAHLQTVRLAWRNEVMHPKQSYTQAEAREVFAATRIFMNDLAGLV